MIQVFSEDYVPEKLIHREQELFQINQIYNNFEKFNIGTNLIIRGVSGSGKTSLVKNIILDRKNSLFISCRHTKTAFKTLKDMFSYKGNKHSSDLLKYICNYLTENRNILIFDEVDKLKDFSNFIDMINSIYRVTMVPIIIVTIKNNIVKSMPDDALKTLMFERLDLPSYNSFEIEDILIDRIEKSKIDKQTIPVGSIKLISGISSRIGSCRIGISLLFKCLQYGNFENDFITKTYNNLEKEDWFGFFNDLNDTEKTFFKILLEILNIDGEIDADTLKQELQYREKREYSDSRISQIINLFENYSVLSTYHKNLGRGGGRKRFVKYSSNQIYYDIVRIMDDIK